MATKVEVKQIDALNGGETKVVSVAGLNLVQWLYNLDDVQPYTGKQNQALIVNDAGNGTEWNDGSKLKAIKNIISGVVKVAKSALADLAEKAKLADRATIADDVTNIDGVPAYYAYAMTKAEFEARRNANKMLYAGSGFVEWGKHYDYQSGDPINQGMWTNQGIANCLGMGGDPAVDSSAIGGISQTNMPLVCVDGMLINIEGTMPLNTAYRTINGIRLPNAPLGTQTFNTSTGEYIDYLTDEDPKYHNVADNLNEAVARAFEGDLLNGDFRNNFAHWSGVVSEWSIASDGSAQQIVTTGTTNIHQSIAKKLTTEYRVSIVAKCSFNGGVLLAHLGSVEPNKIPLTTEYKEYTFSRRPTNDQGVYFRLQSAGTLNIKSISIMPVTKHVITTRNDFVFLESWHEEMDEKGVFYPWGNTQYNVTVWQGINTQLSTHAGIDQGYSAFGEDDTISIGRCVQLSNMSTTQKYKMISDPRNNIYYDPETKKLIQVRYRIRVIAGMGNIWENISVDRSQTKSWCYKATTQWVNARGKSTTVLDLGSNIQAGYGSLSNATVKKIFGGVVGAAYASNGQNPATNIAYNGECMAIPIALVERLNQGAYDKLYNEFGTKRFARDVTGDGKVNQMNLWYENYSHQNKESMCSKHCFLQNVWNSDTNNEMCAWRDSGYISTGVSGCPDQSPYKYFDAVYAGQVEDLRLSAHKQDTRKMMEDAIRSAVAGVMRGKGRLPYLPVLRGADNIDNIRGTDKLYANAGIFRIRDMDGNLRTLYTAPDSVKHLQNLNMFLVRDDGEFYRLGAWGNQYHTALFKWDGSKWIDLADLNNIQTHNFICIPYVYTVNSTQETPDTSLFYTKASQGNWSYYYNDRLDPVFYMEQEFDILPWTDIIGHPTHVAKTFPNGIYGQWLPVIVDGTTKHIPLSVKNNIASISYNSSTNDGETWVYGASFGINTTTNTVNTKPPHNIVEMWYYPTMANPTTPANNDPIIGELGKVVDMSNPLKVYGNRLMQSLIGKYGTNGADGTAPHWQTINGDYYFGASEIGGLGTGKGSPTHHPIAQPIPTNNSYAAKAMYSITEIDGLLYLQLHGNGMKYKAISIQNRTPNQTMNLNRGDMVRLSGFDNPLVNGKVLQISKSVGGAWASDALNVIIFVDVSGNCFLENGSVYASATVWNGSGWGDDSTISIISKEGNKRDLNDNIVKTFCHHSMIPLGIASYTDSSQAK